MEKYTGFFINDERRQHINLSNYAMKIIERDMIHFNRDYKLKNKSGFLNRVLDTYWNEFPLSPIVVLKNITKIHKKLSHDDLGKRIVERIVEEFSTEIMKDTINNYSKMFSNDVTFKLKLNNSNFELLKDFEEAYYFDEYAPRSGASFYLKILFESYAKLPRYKREEVYYKEEIKLINKAISSNKRLRICTDGDYFAIVPYVLEKEMDKLSHKLLYLDVNSVNSHEDSVTFSPNMITLNKISGIKIYKEFNEAELDMVRMLRDNSLNINIMPHHTSAKAKMDVKVQFTYYGAKRFEIEEDDMTIIGLPCKDKKRTYVFTETESDIFWNIFKFGSHAQIIEPISLRNKFKDFYEHASKIYRDKNQIDQIDYGKRIMSFKDNYEMCNNIESTEKEKNNG